MQPKLPIEGEPNITSFGAIAASIKMVGWLSFSITRLLGRLRSGIHSRMTNGSSMIFVPISRRVGTWRPVTPKSWPHCKRFLSRSEEHTSEPQSLMRITYAVFGLKKQTNSHRYSIDHLCVTT